MAYPEPIAIIGTGCKFTGSSSSPSKLWDLLSHPRNVASRVPADRFNIDAFYHPDGSVRGTTNVKESYFLSDDVKKFDASFFNNSASEADSIDPQQRILLETVYESLEAAGLQLHTLQGSSTGVFCGVMNDDFAYLMGLDSKCPPKYAATGVARTNLANRISYFFNWNGPSLTVDTACSSSMVALHQAVNSLRAGESGVAVVTGVNLIFSPNMYISASTMHMLSPTGRCRMWDADADGYARGEGIASIVLKRLQDAVAANDPIECIIRSTGVNQDGRTMGITMPSGAAQLQLIRSTYAAAGLDPENRSEDRCQYFEAHGTGTLAGDPQEASAIYNAFFPGSDPTKTSAEPSEDQLYVGSIKTVIGHTEGTAGLAGIIKASLCLQHGTIAPNLHFNKANPELSQFTSRLVVPTEPVPWPQLAPGVPRRISVNSFGFGGTNAHAILESYEQAPAPHQLTNGSSTGDTLPIPLGVLPFVFSETSERSLTLLLQRYLKYIQDNPLADHANLAWSLLNRRTVFTYRLVSWASTVAELGKKIEEQLQQQDNKLPITISRPTNDSKKILGIFTGQGAQWPQMALDLIDSCPVACRWFEAMQYSLDQLPGEYRPDFSLVNELRAEEPLSRISKPVISQTLCTAVQIVQVNMLSALGISFSTVVGHSSGEIAAAYATGALSAHDAIRIAYLRGWAISNAEGPSGAMMAASLSMEDAISICTQEQYKGRIIVAACNSPSSVTFSGDKEAIYQLKKLLREKDVFIRLLRVNTAYHSHHMSLYSGSYRQALEACNILLNPMGTTEWYSSVHLGRKMNDSLETDSFGCEYWVNNLVSPVLFQQALTSAVTGKSGLPDLIVEIGPHPALKGPAIQTLSSIQQSAADICYTGLLSRGEEGIKTMAEAIGSFWISLPPGHIQTTQYARLFKPSYMPRFLRDLPVYPFDHSPVHWFETRQMRANSKALHRLQPLLGSLTPDCAEGEWRWRNYLRQDEIEWLDGHRIQSQTVFPATGYIAMAVEACNIVSLEMQRTMQLVQVRQLIIDNAISFSGDTDEAEILFRLDRIEIGKDSMLGAFICSASTGGTLRRCASGQITVTWGEADPALLPSKPMVPDEKLRMIDVDKFYQSLERLGYKYSGAFRSFTSLQRARDRSSGILDNHPNSPFLIHPASMDTGLQALLAAFEAPGDGRLSNLYIPTRIESVTINLNPGGMLNVSPTLAVDATIVNFNPDGFSGDVDMFTPDDYGAIQFEGVHVSPLVPLTKEQDRPIFSTVVWGPLNPNANWKNVFLPKVWFNNIDVPDHIAFLYIKEAREQLTKADCQKLNWHQSRIVAWIDNIISLTRFGLHPVCQKIWLEEDLENVPPLLSKLGGMDAVILQNVGENLLGFLRGQISMLEVLRKDDLLGRFYRETIEANVMNERIGNVVGQIAFRFPRMRILEVGAGTGSANRCVLNRIGRSYHSYTFTDISAGFFEEAEAAFAEHSDRFIYQVLDLEQDPVAQGFDEHGYDLVIASNVLHATKSLEETLRRVRRLLKPGGYLAALEGTNLDVIRIAFTVCGFEGWWLGEDDGRQMGALISRDAWEVLLQKTGFGGFETISSLDDPKLSAYSVFVSQAIDAHIRRVGEPPATESMSSTKTITANEAGRSQDLIIIGGSTKLSSPLVVTLEKILASHFRRIICVSKEEHLFSHLESLSSPPIVLTLAEVDEPCFHNLTERRLQALKEFVSRAQKLLWVTAGSEAENPYLSMSRGFLQSLRYERPQCLFQHLNVVYPSALDARLLATTLMRLAYEEFPNDYTLSNSVGSIEPDLRLEDGIMKIARLRCDNGMNQRYNACQRDIKVPASLDQVVVRVNWRSDGSRWTLVEDRPRPIIDVKETQDSSRIWIVVSYSMLHALKVDGGSFLHLVIGRNARTNSRVLALSDQHASVISIPACYCIELPNSGIADDDEAVILQRVATAMVALSVLDATIPGKAVLVHEADAALQRAIQSQAAFRNVLPLYTTHILQDGEATSIQHLHPRLPARKLTELFHDNLSTIVRFDSKGNGTFGRLGELLGEKIEYLDMEDLFRPSALLYKECKVHQIAEKLRLASHLSTELVECCKPINPIRVGMLPDVPQDSLSGFQIMDWTKSQQILVHTQQASSQITLSAHKTYLLVGMTGDLGQSVCHWMITRGARNLVLASRIPKLEPSWLGQMANLGAQVVPMAMDVTNRKSVENVDCIIREQLPPVAGVVNGAMVLVDGMFSDSSLEDIQAVLRPKVEGSLLLDELYSDDDLEFFILFGSIVGIFGNWSQSSYSAGIEFLSSLIQRRRQRNLVGSVIHPGEIQGVGYVARQGPGLLEHMKNTLGDNVISESDLNELFAEAILAGHPSTGRNPDIVAGMATADPSKQPDIIWYQNPKPWDFIEYHTESMASHVPSDAVPLKVQLEGAYTMTDATAIIRASFVSKLHSKLHLPQDKEISPEAHLSELGVDSLVAVDLRMWFAKVLGIDMPVLEILGGASIDRIANSAAGKVRQEADAKI